MNTEDDEFKRIEREARLRRAQEDDDTTCYESELNAAVLAEREACAQVCDEYDLLAAAAIRARSKA